MHIKLSALLLCLLPLAAGAAGPLIPVEHFTEQETYSHPRISPDGKHLAIKVRIMRGKRSVPTMSIFTLPELKKVSTIALQGWEIPVDFTWVDNRRLVVAKGMEVGLRVAPQATGEVVAVNLDGSAPQYLYGYKN